MSTLTSSAISLWRRKWSIVVRCQRHSAFISHRPGQAARASTLTCCNFWVPRLASSSDQREASFSSVELGNPTTKESDGKGNEIPMVNGLKTQSCNLKERKAERGWEEGRARYKWLRCMRPEAGIVEARPTVSCRS